MYHNKNSNSFQLATHHITCSRGDRVLIENLSFSVSDGELLQIVGQNGVGKTTLLRALTGVVPLQAGEVLCQGQRIQNDRLRYHRHFYYLGHQIGIKDELTVLENIRLEARVAQEKRNDFMDQLDLLALKNSLSRQLSAGQRQCVAWIKLILSNARLWILDEPFASLDMVAMEKVQNIMAQQLKNGGSIIFTSHRALTSPLLSARRIHLPKGGGE